ncbi:uncharacterized protein LOC143277596 [Babylonia areolata]|uniref:uncharacterized protein LOC143277596 n=1 Tax=Babylonia areolata TaxID=304850 RepID=UPI003FD606B8
MVNWCYDDRVDVSSSPSSSSSSSGDEQVIGVVRRRGAAAAVVGVGVRVRVVLAVALMCFSCLVGVGGVETFSVDGMSTRMFEDLPGVVEVECSGRTLGPQVELFSLSLYAIEQDVVLASVTVARNECGTSSSFSACFVDKADPFNTKLKTLVVDLKRGEERLYGCNVSLNTAGRPHIIHWAIAASLASHYGEPVLTSTSQYPTYTTFTAIDIAVAAEVQESFTDVPVPTSAVIGGLVMLTFFILLTVIMIILRHKGGGRQGGSSGYDSPSSLSSPKDEVYAKPCPPHQQPTPGNSPAAGAGAGGDRKPGGGGGEEGGGGAGSLIPTPTPSHSPAHLLPAPHHHPHPHHPHPHAHQHPRSPACLLRYQSPIGELTTKAMSQGPTFITRSPGVRRNTALTSQSHPLVRVGPLT